MHDRCSTQREQHHKRHRDIASIVYRILRLDDSNSATTSPLPGRTRWSKVDDQSEVTNDDEDDSDYSERTSSAATEWTDPNDPKDEIELKPATRREKKAARKVARDKARFSGLGQYEIDRISEILHPKESSRNDEGNGSDPLQCSIIEDNIAFNAHTFKYSSLRTNIHTKRLIKNNGSSKDDNPLKCQYQDAEITTFIRQLGIDPSESKSPSKGRRPLLVKLREGIRDDLKCVENENRQRMIRKAGYWRYANKRAYNDMIQRREIWDWETGAKLEEVDAEEDVPDDISSVPASMPDEYWLPRYHRNDSITKRSSNIGAQSKSYKGIISTYQWLFINAMVPWQI